MPDKPNTANDSSTRKWRKLWHLLQVLGILAGIAYAVVTWLMWRDSHKNFVIDERAWVNVTGATLMPKTDIKDGGMIDGSLQLHNSGKTPAKRIVCQVKIAIFSSAQKTTIDYSGPSVTESNGVFNPNSFVTFKVEIKPDRQVLTKDEADDLLNGRAYIAIYARGRYYDVFGESHWFHSCSWENYYSSGSYNTSACSAYNDTGDGVGDVP